MDMDLVFNEYLGAIAQAADLGALHTVYVYARLLARAGLSELALAELLSNVQYDKLRVKISTINPVTS